MPESFYTIALEAIRALQAQERRTESLTAQLNKSASVDSDLVKRVVDVLCKTGSLNKDQAVQAAALLTKDPNAPLRCIEELLTADRNIKTAAQNDLRIGKLVSGEAQARRQKRDSYEVVADILRRGKNNRG